MMRYQGVTSTSDLSFPFEGFQSEDEDDMNFSTISDPDPVPIDFDDACMDAIQEDYHEAMSHLSPTDPTEELGLMMEIDLDYLQAISVPTLSDDEEIEGLPFEERLRRRQEKLVESMKRSKETRKVLDTPHLYNRRNSVQGVLQSVEQSTLKVESFLKEVDTDQYLDDFTQVSN